MARDQVEHYMELGYEVGIGDAAIFSPKRYGDEVLAPTG